MMRGRLIFAFDAEIARLDTEAQPSGFDPEFKEALGVAPSEGSPPQSLRREHPPVRVPCQVEPKTFEGFRMLPSGSSPRSHLDLILHARDLEALSWVDRATGNTGLSVGDRLVGIFRRDGETVLYAAPRPGLYATEVRPLGWGLNLARPRRNLLLVRFEDRQQGTRRRG